MEAQQGRLVILTAKELRRKLETDSYGRWGEVFSADELERLCERILDEILHGTESTTKQEEGVYALFTEGTVTCLHANCADYEELVKAETERDELKQTVTRLENQVDSLRDERWLEQVQTGHQKRLRP